MPDWLDFQCCCEYVGPTVGGWHEPADTQCGYRRNTSCCESECPLWDPSEAINAEMESADRVNPEIGG